MKRLISVLLSLVIVFSCFSCISITSASAIHSNVESAVQWALNIANDDSHGYSQLASRRWGNPDYDCSSLVITAFKNAGFNVGSATYTGNMRSVFVNAGFTWIPKSQINLSNSSQLQRGDILLNESTHVEIYIGNNQRVGAHTGYIDIYDTNYPGDNTGNEISVYNYSNSSNWDGILRYTPQEPVNYPEGISAFGYDYPVDGQEIADKEFVFQGWVETTKEISSITCSINDGQTYIKAGLYTRPDVPNATAFLTTIPTKHLNVGSNKIAVCVNYRDGSGVVAECRTVNRTRPTVKCGYDYPTENQNILDPTFIFQGWVESDKEIQTITCSLNDGQKYIKASLYKREDVPDATAFRTEINSNYLSYGENKVSVCVTYTDGKAETVAMRKVNKQYAYALDDPEDKIEIKDETFLFQGWFLTEKDIEKIQCIINDQTTFDANLYTREDVPDAVAFRRPIYTRFLTRYENEISLSVTYSDGTSEIFEKRKIYNDNVLGDADGDGEITIKDATAIQKHLTSLLILDDASLAVADANGDGIINISDATQIQKYLARLIDKLG